MPRAITIQLPNLRTFSFHQSPRKCRSLISFIALTVSLIAIATFSLYNVIQQTPITAKFIVPSIVILITFSITFALFILYLICKRLDKNVYMLRAIDVLSLIVFVVAVSFLSYVINVTQSAIAIGALVVLFMELPLFAMMAFTHYKPNRREEDIEMNVHTNTQLETVSLAFQSTGQQLTSEQEHAYNELILASSQEPITSCCTLKAYSCEQLECNKSMTALAALACVCVLVSIIATLFASNKLTYTEFHNLLYTSKAASVLLLIASAILIIYLTYKHKCKYITSSMIFMALAALSMLSVSIVLMSNTITPALLITLIGAICSLIFLVIALVIRTMIYIDFKQNIKRNPTQQLDILLATRHDLAESNYYVI